MENNNKHSMCCQLLLLTGVGGLGGDARADGPVEGELLRGAVAAARAAACRSNNKRNGGA